MKGHKKIFLKRAVKMCKAISEYVKSKYAQPDLSPEAVKLCTGFFFRRNLDPRLVLKVSYYWPHFSSKSFLKVS